ncbi:MAG: hypothetical protein HQK76_19510 [Desulfobacterales bacterium]|nr:hypothetical protein [Desulfobacterales bacterium]
MKELKQFSNDEIKIVSESVSIAEDRVSNFYKMSSNEWVKLQYDIRTLKDLLPDEISNGHFAQILRYTGKKNNKLLPSFSFDHFRVCIQDHSIISTLINKNNIRLLPFMIYVVTHELVHIVRFMKFRQFFFAPDKTKEAEEIFVNKKTYEILSDMKISGIQDVLDFYAFSHGNSY